MRVVIISSQALDTQELLHRSSILTLHPADFMLEASVLGRPSVAILPCGSNSFATTSPGLFSSIEHHRTPHPQEAAGLGLASEEDVDTNSVTNWEKGHTSPRLHFVPRIIEFLWYVPFSGEGKRLGQHIVQMRRALGVRRTAGYGRCTPGCEHQGRPGTSRAGCHPLFEPLDVFQDAVAGLAGGTPGPGPALPGLGGPGGCDWRPGK